MSRRVGSIAAVSGLRSCLPLIRMIALGGSVAALAGCSAIGPLAGGFDTAPVGSIQRVSAHPQTPPVDSTDWQTMRMRMVGTMGSAVTDSNIEWSNSITGSTGSFSPTSDAKVTGGILCRSFVTTINDVRGVRRYRGEACRQADGAWRIGDLRAEDAILS